MFAFKDLFCYVMWFTLSAMDRVVHVPSILVVFEIKSYFFKKREKKKYGWGKLEKFFITQEW